VNILSQDPLSRLGASPTPDGEWQFLVWAPNAGKLELHLSGVRDTILPMQRDARGYHRITVNGLESDASYLYRFEDSRERPDPASRFQPCGVHAPSRLVDLNTFDWNDSSWKGRPLEGSVFYEVHVGTYTPEGTFEALAAHLPELVRLGVTTIELMPIAQFPGNRNWGYDGVFPFAPQNSYGGPRGLQTLVNAAHSHGLAVALDVVYNHFGPEGNYFGEYGPYFRNVYSTPWGQAINFDGPDCDPVRRFFIENAIYWLEEYHLDALRLDAIHGIFDFGARHFLAELREAVQGLENRLGRRLHLIAESDLNDSRVLHSPSQGGYGLHAQWSDDFHHSLHSLLTGEKAGYYADFGGLDSLAETLRNGWYFSGQFSEFRRRRHGNSPRGLENSRFVICNQNHDQVGNRATGERLSQLVDFEKLKLAAGVTLLVPFTPLLFMGEEYGETAPFQYFTSHGDPALAAAVREGRQQEFSAFGWNGDVPDPQSESTFERSKLDHRLKHQEPHRTLCALYQQLLGIRREYLANRNNHAEVCEPTASPEMPAKVRNNQNFIALLFPRCDQHTALAVIFHFGSSPDSIHAVLPEGSWSKRLESADSGLRGPGSQLPAIIRVHSSVRSVELNLQPWSFVVLEHSGSGA
jgi:maltooligosyltrehalose trehalohydrolase